MTDEAALLEAARRYDADALATIFDQYAPALYKYAFNLCHNSAEADNIVGDAFAQLLEHLAAGKGPRTNLRSYLYQITYHIVINRIRYYAYRISQLDEVANVRSHETSVHGQIEDLELMGMLRSALMNELTDDQRHVVVLRFLEGFSLQETASITGKSVTAVKLLQNRGIAKLRQVLDESRSRTR